MSNTACAALLPVCLLLSGLSVCGGGSNEAPPQSSAAAQPINVASAARQAASAVSPATAVAASAVTAAAAAPAPSPTETPGVSVSSIVLDGRIGDSQLSTPPSALNASVLTASVSTARSFASYQWLWSLECAGKAMGANAIPESGYYAPAHGSGSAELRFGKVADPLNASRRVIQFRAARSDPVVAGAPRCELGFSPTQSGKLPLNDAFWFAFGLHLPGWLPSSDAQIIAQWHTSGTGTEPLNPLFSMIVKGGDIHIEARANGSSTPTKAGTSTPVNLKSALIPNSRWSYFVVQARISTDGGHAPFLRVWRDGLQIVNYSGPLGYNIPGGIPYAKIGHYHWIDASNPWPAGVPVRTVLMRSPTVVLDATQRYHSEDLRGYVMAN